MQKDIGRYTVTVSLNTRYCFGIGFERYPIIEWAEEGVATVTAWVTRLDFLFFFINFAKYPKVAWRE
jgi:hypothetical protein